MALAAFEPSIRPAHLNIHKHESEGIILTISSSEFSFCTVNIADDSSSIVSRKFNHPSPRHPYTTIEGSCFGLVLVKQSIKIDSWSLNLFNPITLETLEIPESSDSCYGLGYDSLHDDYKIVSILRKEPRSICIYSVKMGTWRSLGNSPYQHFKHEGLFVEDSIYWLASTSDEVDKVVVAFSLTREEFMELPLPKDFNKDMDRFYFSLTVVRGCIALINTYYMDVFDLWVMKDYGVQGSWTKYSFTPENRTLIYVGVLEEDEIVFTKSLSLKLVSYNWRTGIWRDMVHAGKPGIAHLVIHGTRSFRESLISPNYGH